MGPPFSMMIEIFEESRLQKSLKWDCFIFFFTDNRDFWRFMHEVICKNHGRFEDLTKNLLNLNSDV